MVSGILVMEERKTKKLKEEGEVKSVQVFAQQTKDMELNWSFPWNGWTEEDNTITGERKILKENFRKTSKMMVMIPMWEINSVN